MKEGEKEKHMERASKLQQNQLLNVLELKAKENAIYILKSSNIRNKTKKTNLRVYYTIETLDLDSHEIEFAIVVDKNWTISCMVGRPDGSFFRQLLINLRTEIARSEG